MALTYGTNTYAGQAASEFIADMLLAGNTIAGNHITVHPAIKGKKVIQTITTDAVFQARADAFTASGTTTVGERTLTLANIMSQDKIGINVLLDTWQSVSQADSANDKNVPTNMADFVIDYKAQKIALQIDELIWRGDTALTGNTIRKWHNGLTTLAIADSGVTKYATTTGELTPTAVSVGATTTLTVASATTVNVGDKVYCKLFTGADAATLNLLTFTVLSTTATTIVIDAVTTGLTITTGGTTRIQFINASNVLTYMANAFRVSREQDRTAADFRIYVPIHIADAYVDASLAVATGQGVNYEQQNNLVYKGIPIVKCSYFPENMIFTSCVSNLHFGTDLVNDQNEVIAKYMGDITLDDEYRFSAKFSSSVNYGFADGIKIYRPA
jgi:hypothetical protein